MALTWRTDGHSEVFTNAGHSIQVGFIESAETGERTYRIASGERWGVAIFIADVQFLAYADFSTEAEAKAQAEQWEAERNSNYAAGHAYTKTRKPDATVEIQRGFAGLWADRYSFEGLTIAQAWDDYAG